MTNRRSKELSDSLLHSGRAGWSIVSILMILLLAVCAPAALATRIPAPLKKAMGERFPKAKFRLDAVVKTSEGSMLVPLIPPENSNPKFVSITGEYPTVNPRMFTFSNGWMYVRLLKSKNLLILSAPESLPAEIKEKIKRSKLPSDLIVPDGMTATVLFKNSIGDLDIDVGIPTARKSSPGSPAVTTGAIYLTSPQTGKIAVMNSSFKKETELQTDGTPGGMAFSNGMLYVTDQTKDRILIVNPKTKSFSGQINLQKGGSPKGIAALPDANFLYVSESARANVSVVELKTRKVLLRTRVRPGPGRIAITPNGYMIIVLNVQSGEVTFISTLNYKVVGFVRVGQMPSDVLITKDSKTAYVSNRISNTISVLDITHRRVRKTLKTGDGPTGMALSDDETQLFVANAKDNSITVFDLTTMERRKEVRLPLDVEFPGSVILLPDKKNLMVTSAATDTCGILSLESMEFEKQPLIGYTSVNAIFVPNVN